MIKKTIFLPILAVIVLGGTARAQELDDGSRYAPFYGQDDGQGYAGQRGARWAPPETDYRYDSGDSDPGQYDPGQEDPGYYDPGQDDGASGDLQGSQPQRAFDLIGLAQLCGITFGTIAIQPALIERQHPSGGVGVDIRVGSNALLRQLLLRLFHGRDRYRRSGMTGLVLFPLRGRLAG